MNGPRIGSLFSGYGGLELGVRAALGGHTIWHSENNPAPSKVLAYHYPGVPNLGDVTTVDWATVPRVDILTGGTPCQDVSSAGRRAGMTHGTRSNLWSAMADAIEALRPPLVVWENVRGVTSTKAASSVEHCPRCMGDGPRESLLRALGRVLGDLADIGYDAQWHGLRASDIGAPHERLRIFLVATDSERGRRYGRAQEPWWQPLGRAATSGPSDIAPADATSSRRHRRQDGGTSDGHEGTRARRGQSQRDGGEPTTDAEDNRQQRLGATRGRWPGPPDGDNEDAADTNEPRPQRRHELGSRRTDQRAIGPGRVDVARWGPYAGAVRRWERVTGRAAPEPTTTGPRGGQRLNPVLVEWLMGLPEGHVTEPDIGLSHRQQLKTLGNGVVPQQACAAIWAMGYRP